MKQKTKSEIDQIVNNFINSYEDWQVGEREMYTSEKGDTKINLRSYFADLVEHVIESLADQKPGDLIKLEHEFYNTCTDRIDLIIEGALLNPKINVTPKKIFEFFLPYLSPSEDKDKFHKEMKRFKDTLDYDLPENMPLYKDSGLWQLRSDDTNEVILHQRVEESFINFIDRCKQYNREEILKP